jgi:hypothetical protein
MKIRLLLISILFISIGGGAPSQSPERADSPYIVTIKADSRTMKSGTKLSIDVAFTNRTDRAVVRPPIEIESMGFVVDVSHADGRTVPLTERGKVWRHQGGWSGSGPVFSMEPGVTAHRKIVVTDLYDMTRLGEYSIHLHRSDVSTNTITVEVKP